MMQSNVAQLYNCTYMFYLILKKFQKIETKKDTLSHWRSSYNNHGQMYTLGSHRIGKRLQGPKLRLVFKKMLYFFAHLLNDILVKGVFSKAFKKNLTNNWKLLSITIIKVTILNSTQIMFPSRWNPCSTFTYPSANAEVIFLEFTIW